MLKTNKQLNRGTETQKYKKEPKQRHMTQGNKEKEAENSNQGFWAEVCVRIHKPAYAGQLYAYAYFKPMCAYRIMHALTHP